MADLILAALCETVVVDSVRNTISLMNLIEDVTVAGLPVQLPRPAIIPFRFDLVCAWRRTIDATSETLRGRFTLHYPDGTKVVGPDFPINLETAARFRSIVQIHALEFRAPGRHVFHVEQSHEPGKWKEIAMIPFHIQLAAPSA